MKRSSTIRGAAAAIVALVAVLAFVVGAAFGRGSDGGASPTPSNPPTAQPSTPPAPPSPAPTDNASDGEIEVDLDVATPHDVSVVVKDETGGVVGATSGRAGDGMSVRWSTMSVVNLDDDTLRVTWVGFPQDEVARLRVYELDGSVALTLVSAGPPANSDALGHDRVVDIDFASPVSAEAVLTSVQGSTDTAD